MKDAVDKLQSAIDALQALNPRAGSDPESERVFEALTLCQTAMGWLVPSVQ
ncbi:MAG TPA: hypothetical protein VMR62_27660 [Bryobacteraceae bacterium]|nr:hypothetical protein [Bryobacteraceae bacterium]